MYCSLQVVTKFVMYILVVLGIELLTACQGMEFLRPLKSTPPLEAVHELVRSKVKCVMSSLYTHCVLIIHCPGR